MRGRGAITLGRLGGGGGGYGRTITGVMRAWQAFFRRASPFLSALGVLLSESIGMWVGVASCMLHRPNYVPLSTTRSEFCAANC